MSSSVEINSFIKRVSEKYNIDEIELCSIWNNKMNIDTNKVDHSLLKTLSKSELVSQCKAKQLKVTGTKDELIAILTGNEPAKKVTKKSEAKSKEVVKPVIKKIQSTLSTIKLRFNQFSNFEHRETSLVFNKDKQVIGKQMEDGNIASLTKEDIETCKQYKFSFVLPENINTNSKESVSIDELNDEEIIEEEDEVVDDEEEEEEEIEELEYDE